MDPSPQQKITFAEAARQAGLHPNTVRNWNKMGKLNTAEKIIENGSPVWVVTLEEVLRVAQQGNITRHDRNVDPSPQMAAQQGASTSLYKPESDSALTIIGETVLKPLTDLVERQSKRIEELSEEVGRLRAEVEHLKETSPRQEAPQSPQPPKDLSQHPSQEQEKPRRRWPWSR